MLKNLTLVTGLALCFLITACATDDDPTDSGSSKTQDDQNSDPSAGAKQDQTEFAPLKKDVDATLVTVSDIRTASFDEANNNAMSSYLTLSVKLKGPSVLAATFVGNSKVTRAVDDQDNSLPLGQFQPSGNMRKIRDGFQFGGETEPKDELVFQVQLKSPPRSSTKLVAIEGTVALRAVQTEKIRIPGGTLMSAKGKPLDLPELKKAGITVEIQRINQPGTMVDFRASGKTDSLVSYEIVDAKGKKLNNGSGSFGFGDNMNYQLMGNSKISEAMFLEISVESDRQDLQIPFKFENIVLP